jgi:hypothetical protein
MGVRLVLFYAWAQSLHYGIWLRLIPEDDRDRPSPRTWVRTWRALRDELGVAVVLGTVALTLGLALWAAWDLAAARGGYLRFVRFHGFLELAAGAVFLVEGRPVRPVEEAPA